MCNFTNNDFFERFIRCSVSFILIIFVSIGLPKSALLAVTQESQCKAVEEENLRRDDSYKYKLAIKQNSGWIVCPSNDEINPVHEINFDNSDYPKKVIFKWAVPKSENNEFIYVSSTIGESHPLSLYRNSAMGALASFIPFLDDELKLVRSFDPKSKSIKQQFIDVHHHTNSQPGEKFLEHVKKWHNTGLWGTKINTDKLVKEALHSKNREAQINNEIGAERLLRIRGGRPLISWIEFRSRKPKFTENLTVTLFYSGDGLESLVKYKFQFVGKK